MEIKLTNLERVIADCWDRAEKETAEAISLKYPGPNEEQVTFLFAGELRLAVGDASRTRRIEEAFLSDLGKIYDIDFHDVQRARGLIARVSFHSRQHEGSRSASDLGVVIRRPRVDLGMLRSAVKIQPDYARGLLAQAKLGRQNNEKLEKSSYGKLTKRQEQLIPDRIAYFSILLYRLGGNNADQLAPFVWQICKDHTVADLKRWLSTGHFPEELSSRKIIEGLFAGTIGTQDRSAIEDIIDPVRGQAINLEIFWPEGPPPPPHLRRNYQDNRKTQTLKICH